MTHTPSSITGELVEKVARAICAVNEPDPDEHMLPGTPCWVALIPEARAAIAAMPLEAMREALEEAREAIASLPEDALGTANLPDGWTGQAILYPIRDELLAKIDAALSAQAVEVEG